MATIINKRKIIGDRFKEVIASMVTFLPTSTLTSTTAQAAIEEVDDKISNINTNLTNLSNSVMIKVERIIKRVSYSGGSADLGLDGSKVCIIEAHLYNAPNTHMEIVNQGVDGTDMFAIFYDNSNARMTSSGTLDIEMFYYER